MFTASELALVRPLLSHRRTRQAHLQVQHQSEVTNPHQETGTIHQQPHQKDINRASDERLRDLPEWSEEFTDNLGRHRSACIRTHFA